MRALHRTTARPAWAVALSALLCVLGATSCRHPAAGTAGRPAPAAQKAPTRAFTLGAGDQISISVWRHDELNRSLQVDPAGRINLPLAGEVIAANLTVPELRDRVADALKRYVVDPQVDINVTSIRSRRYHVMGEVQSPGTFTLDRAFYVWEGVPSAGGFTDDANSKKLVLIRKDSGRARVEVVNVERMLKSGDVDQHLYIEDGDVLYVPPLTIANVERFMTRLNNIVNTLVTFERAVILEPSVVDAIKGADNQNVVVAQ